MLPGRALRRARQLALKQNVLGLGLGLGLALAMRCLRSSARDGVDFLADAGDSVLTRDR